MAHKSRVLIRLCPLGVISAPPRDRVGARIFSPRTWDRLGRGLHLSRRELDVVRGIFDDRTEFAIACDLAISPRTVHTYVERLYRKLGTNGRPQLVLRIMTEFLSTVAPSDRVPSVACPYRHRCRAGYDARSTMQRGVGCEAD